MEIQKNSIKQFDCYNKCAKNSNFGDYQLKKRPFPSLDEILEYTSFLN